MKMEEAPLLIREAILLITRAILSTIEETFVVVKDQFYSVRIHLEMVNSPNSSLSHDSISRPFKATSN